MYFSTICCVSIWKMHYIYSKMLKFICRDSRVFAHNAIAILFTNTLQFSAIKKCFSVSIIDQVINWYRLFSIGFHCYSIESTISRLKCIYFYWFFCFSTVFCLLCMEVCSCLWKNSLFRHRHWLFSIISFIVLELKLLFRKEIC